MDLHFTIKDEATFVKLINKTGTEDSLELFNLAFDLLGWGLTQIEYGRDIASISGGNVCHTLKLQNGKLVLIKSKNNANAS